MPQRERDVSIDADVLMNLYATGHIEEILAASADGVVVASRVEREALWVEGDEPGSRVPVEIDGLVGRGSLARATPTPRELERFVELARELDDGEAEALAVALERGAGLASDDRKAATVAARLGVSVLTTPDLVIAWSETGVDGAVVADAIRRIEQRASFAPRTSHPRAEEWRWLREIGQRTPVK